MMKNRNTEDNQKGFAPAEPFLCKHIDRNRHTINKKGRNIMFPIETISARMLDYYVGREDAMIIDLRDTSSYKKGHVKGAVNIPYDRLGESRTLDRNRLLIFYCDRGGASMAAAREYVRKGYRTRSVIGGFQAYRGRNLVQQ